MAVAVILGVLLVPLGVLAQQQPGKPVVIGFLGVGGAAAYATRVEALRAGLRDLGYIEGQNIAIEFRWAEGDDARLAELAAELVRLRVDIIVTHATPGIRAAKRATSTIPIVIASVAGDPVASGLVASLARPGGNVTGSTSINSVLNAKRLELLREACPTARRVAILLAPESRKAIVDALEPAARALKLELHLFDARGPADFDTAFSAMAKAGVDAVAVSQDAMLINHAMRIAELAAKRRLPSIGARELADAGGLLGYGASRSETFRRAAYFVDRILKGAKPGDLPIEQPTKFDLVVNLKTAKTLGVSIPRSLLVRADEVIQ